jgi:hypothetical protein
MATAGRGGDGCGRGRGNGRGAERTMWEGVGEGAGIAEGGEINEGVGTGAGVGAKVGGTAGVGIQMVDVGEGTLRLVDGMGTTDGLAGVFAAVCSIDMMIFWSSQSSLSCS